MKKILSFFLLMLCLQTLSAQRSAFFVSENKLFYEGKTMFNDENYAGCIDKLTEFNKICSDKDLLKESAFLLIACDFRQGQENILFAIRDYLEENPETIHRNDIAFMIGSCYFKQNDYLRSILWLEQTDLDNLSKKDQEDCAYRIAFSYIQEKRYDEAFRLLRLLSENSTKYGDASTYYLACIYYSKEDFDSALRIFTQLKENQIFQSESLYYITQINFVQGRYTQTIKDGKEFLAAYPQNNRNAELNRIIGISYFEEGNYPAAYQHLFRFMESGGSLSIKDNYILGLSLFHIQNYSDAIRFLGESASKNDIIGQSANFFLGQSYLKNNHRNNALMAFEAASTVDFDPQVKEAAMYNYAILLYKSSTSAFGESITVLENFLNTYPHSIYADQINNCLVEIYFTTKNYDTALQSIERIKNPDRKILDAKQKIYYHLGTVCFANTQFETAINYFTQSIKLGDYAPQAKALATYWRGESLFRLNRFDKAINDYLVFRESGVKSENLHILVNYNLGYSYFNKEQFSTALSYFSTYINQETDNSKISLADAYARSGDCYFQARNFTAAENAYSKAATLQPSMAEYALFQKGYVLGLQKNYSGKIEQMNKIIKDYPNSRYVSDALYEKGRAYVMLNNTKSAIETFTILWEKYPDNKLARKAGIQIGLLYFNTNELQKSVETYKKVISKYPDSEEARVAIQDLKSVYVDLGDVEGYAGYVNSLGGTATFEISEQDSLTYLAAERLLTKGDIPQAQTAFKKYIQSFPNGSYTNNALTHLASVQYKEKNYSEALDSYTKLNNIATNRSDVITGLSGIVRSASKLNKHADVLNTASTLLKEPDLSPEISTETKYHQAKAYLSLNEQTKALPVLKDLAQDTRTVYGAESKYLVALFYFDSHQYDLAENEILDYTKIGTPHAYWLARSFILLSDIYISKNNYLQAKQYLESLQQNYKQKDDIQDMINERLSKI